MLNNKNVLIIDDENLTIIKDGQEKKYNLSSLDKTILLYRGDGSDKRPFRIDDYIRIWSVIDFEDDISWDGEIKELQELLNINNLDIKLLKFDEIKKDNDYESFGYIEFSIE